MAHDRTSGNTLPLTHEFLSLMLGVRRAGVTEALQSLKRQKLIDNGRNKIVVLNRKGIERAAGKSYGTPKWSTDALLVRIIVGRARCEFRCVLAVGSVLPGAVAPGVFDPFGESWLQPRRSPGPPA
jgi:hypothetical protein